MKLRLRTQNKALQKGFTIIELLAAVAIISIIAALAVNRYGNAVVNARSAKAATVITAVEKAKDLYVAQDNRTADEIRSFNTLDNAKRYELLQPYLLVNGGTVSSSVLLEGTGFSVLSPGSLSATAGTVVSGGSSKNIAAQSAVRASLQ